MKEPEIFVATKWIWIASVDNHTKELVQQFLIEKCINKLETEQWLFVDQAVRGVVMIGNYDWQSLPLPGQLGLPNVTVLSLFCVYIFQIQIAGLAFLCLLRSLVAAICTV